MRRPPNGYQGSEIHRLQPMKEGYDIDLFNKLYKVCKPVIKNLSKQIDHRRFNLTPDIITSYFWDKMIFVFNKYYGTCSENILQAKILSALSTFKNKLLRSAYGDMAKFNQHLSKLEDLFDDSKEDTNNSSILDDDTNEYTQKLSDILNDYMKKNLTSDELLIYEIMYNPPKYIQERVDKSKSGKITNLIIIDFFELPRDVTSNKYISQCRSNVKYWLDRAKYDLRNTSIS